MASSTDQRWLFGPARDLFLGCGLGYLVVFVALGFVGESIRTGASPGLIPLLTLVIGAPHYGATLLRVYERRADRRAYAIFSVWATLALFGAFVVATRSAWLGSFILTLYITWSPWHYTGQNYGLAVMMLRRRGVGMDDALKRWIYAAFVLSYVMTFFAIHKAHPAVAAANGYVPTLYPAAGYQMLSLGIPARFADIVIAISSVGWIASTVVAGVGLLRRGSPRDLGPTALLAFTQALWFPIPILARMLGIGASFAPLAPGNSTYYFFYAALGHSVQYVWVTSYFASRTAGFAGYTPYLTKALLAGLAIWTLPPLIFAPDLLGRVPFDAGLGALVASSVNLHHFVLDGAIWKLRDGRIARVLVRSQGVDDGRPPAIAVPSAVGSALRTLGWGAGLASLGIVAMVAFEGEFGLRRAFASGDLARVHESARRLDWVGRESASVHLELAAKLSAHDPPRALREIARSLELDRSPRALALQASLLEDQGLLKEAAGRYAEALELAPDEVSLLYRSGLLALRRGRNAEAQGFLARCVDLDPKRAIYARALERAERASARAAPP